MLFNKPAVFIFKQKLTNITSNSTKHVKTLRISYFNDHTKIKFGLMKKENRTKLANSLWKMKTVHVKNNILTNWFQKKHLKIKLFSRGIILSKSRVSSLPVRDLNTSPSFYWNTINSTDIFFQNINSKNNIWFWNTHCVNSHLPMNIKVFTSTLTSSYLWPLAISLTLTLNDVHFWSINSVTQLTKYFYTNQFMAHGSNFNFFRSYVASFLNVTKKSPIFTFTNNIKSVINNNAVKTLDNTKGKSLTRFFRVLSRYLPHINLVRLFRYTSNKKPLSYSMDKKSFFKNPLIRLNLDYKYYKLNTLQNQKRTSLCQNPYAQFINNISTDNFLETKLDSLLFASETPSFFNTFSDILNCRTTFGELQSQIVKKPYLSNYLSLNLLTTDFLNTQFLLTNALLYKYVFWLSNSQNQIVNSLTNSLTSLNNHLFSSRIDLFRLTNIWPSSFLHFSLKRKILKIFSFNKFLPNVTMWYYNLLIRFMESCTGKKVFLKFNPFIENCLSFTDIARCNMWSIRINSFQRLLGPKIFLNESLRIMHIALRFKDPTFFANWIKGMLSRMSFWKYRLLFRYIKFAMRYLFWLHFSELQFKGLKIKLKGKISVAGNARTRTLVYRIGETGYSKIDNRVICDSSIINTFTGVLGFKIWFFF